jgi:hydrogenase nickel incorporation protein HypB
VSRPAERRARPADRDRHGLSSRRRLDDLDVLFIENVGNLVCPAAYDLGESLRLVLVSVTEGEDKLLKCPTISNSADVAVITKVDLALAVECDMATLERNIQTVRPGMEIFQLSSKSGGGMDGWLHFVASFVANQPDARLAAVIQENV